MSDSTIRDAVTPPQGVPGVGLTAQEATRLSRVLGVTRQEMLLLSERLRESLPQRDPPCWRRAPIIAVLALCTVASGYGATSVVLQLAGITRVIVVEGR